ncbi:uncharacterized protein LOC111634094 [Centruroides sculpturatus]|uniref:uncharacterized protein LOC111634094 n=1 Tax=Centruroides sculpturatus TaxID=218467 RepID=UPI000C6ECDFC|nr:uncharacterized protein LOC111634094 [Centruroides sculpturatus]
MHCCLIILTSSVRMNAEYADENKNSSELFQVNSSSDSEASSVCTALENYNSGSSSNICSNSFLRNVEKSTNKEDNANPNTNLPYKQAELLRNLENEDNANMSFRSTENKDDTSKQIIDNLININHALKLHLELNVFDMDEEFKVAAEVFMMMHNSMTTIMGLLVLSSKKIYFLKLGENFRDEPKNCVTVMEKKNLNQLNSVNILLGNQGFTLNWSTEKYHTCLFKDADHCNCFVTYFTDFIEESKCACPMFRTSAETNLQQVVREVFLAGLGDKKYLPDDVDLEVLMFLLIESCSLDKDGNHPVAIVASSTEICLTQILFAKWTKSTKSFCPVERYRPVAKQKIINIVSLHLCLDTCKVGLHFLDEDANDEFCWSLRTKTRTTLYSLFNTVKELWEKQFGIELICTEDCKYNSETTKEEAATKFVL